MDRRHTLFANLSAPDPKLMRAASLSDLSTMKDFTLKERFHSDTSGSLVKQSSCEAIIDTNKRHQTDTQTSQLAKTNNQESANIWKKEVPTYNRKFSFWSKETNNFPRLQKNLSIHIEHRNLTDTVNSTSKNILAPPKLIINESELEKSFSNSQNSQNSFNRSSSSLLSRYDSCEGFITFKKPLAPSKKSTILKERYVIKDEKVESGNPSKNNLIFSKTDYSESAESKGYDVNKLNKRLRSLVAPTEIRSEKQSRFCKCRTVVYVMLISVAVLYLAVVLNDTDFLNKLCDPHFRINEIPEELSKLIHGQNSAVNEISKFFIEIEKKASFNILVLVGGIGVGKSYTSEIIRSNLKETSNVIDFFPSLYSKENQAYSSLSICKCNLIRLENLKTEDLMETVRFASVLKEKAKNICILILAIFNPEEVDSNLQRVLHLNEFLPLIESKFQEARLEPKIVTYAPLSDEALTKCIKDLSDHVNVELTEGDLENIKEDLKKADSGCKGAYGKIQVTGRMKNNLDV